MGPFLPMPPIGGAVEKRWFAMANEFIKQNHEVCIISKKHKNLKTTEKKNKINFVRVKGYNQPKNIIILKLLDFLYSLRALKKISNNSDIIITNTFFYLY